MSDSVPSHKDALGVDAFTRLYVGACRIDGWKRSLIACSVVLILGRLGLRVAELQHLREGWIDWERGEIRIPELDPCACRRCWIQAYDKWGREGLKELKRAENIDWDGPSNWSACRKEHRKEIIERADYCTPENLKEIVLNEQFGGKYDSSARTISFGWSGRLTAVLMTFFDHKNHLDLTQQGINDLIEEAAENAPGINPKNLSAHNLRATGLTFIADTSVDAKMLKDLAGWQDIQTARKYLRESGRINTHKMYHIMGRGEEAPPTVAEEPGARFPLVLVPTPFKGEPVEPLTPSGDRYDQAARQERAAEDRQAPLKVRHPRDVNIPSPAGMPTKPELDFDITEGPLPGHIDPESPLFDKTKSAMDTSATTLSSFADPHTMDRPRGETAQNWRQTHVQAKLDAESDGTDDKSYGRVSPLLPITAMLDVVARTEEWATAKWDKYIGFSIFEFFEQTLARRLVFVAVMSTLILGMLYAHLVSAGIYDPSTGSISLTTPFVLAALATLYINIEMYADVFEIPLPGGIKVLPTSWRVDEMTN